MVYSENVTLRSCEVESGPPIDIDFWSAKGSFSYYVINRGGRGFPDDCASVILTQYLYVKLITEGGGGGGGGGVKIVQKVIT